MVEQRKAVVGRGVVWKVLSLLFKRILPAGVVALVVKTLVEKPFLRRILQVLFLIASEKVTDAKAAREDGFVLKSSDISAAWLEKELRRSGSGGSSVQVKSVTYTTFGDDMGNASLMHRLSIKYGNNEKGLPETMILKSPKSNLKTRVPFTAARMLEMEARFYSEVAPTLQGCDKINIPRSFASRFREDGNVMILMEDVTLSGAYFVTEHDVIDTVADAQIVARGIAAFHAPFWDSPRLDDSRGGDLASIISQRDPILGMTSEFMKAGWSSCVERMGDRMPKDVQERGHLLIPIAQRLADFCGGGLGGAPMTIAHGDCHLANSYFVDKAGSKELGLYDCQILRRGNGAIDLATYFSGSITEELFANDEDEILTTYLQELAHARGGNEDALKSRAGLQYTLPLLKRDFRIALGLNFCWNVAATMAVPFDTEAQDMYFVYFTRMLNQIDRLGIIDECLATLGARDLHTNAYRGGTMYWDVAPLSKVVPSDDLPHVKHGYKTHRAVHKTLLPGLWSRLKYELKYRFMLTKTKSRGGHHGQKTTGLSPQFLEGHHSPDFARDTPVEATAFDSYYLSVFGNSKKGEPSFALRWCKRAIAERGEVWLAIKVPGDGLWAWTDHPKTQCIVTYDGDDTVVVTSPDGTSTLRFTCVTPDEHWTVSFAGMLKRYPDGPVKTAAFDLSWRQKMDFFSFGTDVSPSLTAKALAYETFSKEWGDELKAAHQEHREVFGRSTGNFVLGDRHFAVDNVGMRDRAYGIRNWAYMQRYVAQYFWTGNQDRFFNVTMASLPTLSNAKFGFHCGDGNSKAIAVDEMSGDFPNLQADGTPAKKLWLAFEAGGIGYTMKMTVEDGDTIPLDMSYGAPESGMLVNLRFAKYEISWVDPRYGTLCTEEGYGASEFGYRFKGADPGKPSLANLKYLPVTGASKH